ncbi:glycoside hydrolase family 43 protein [Lutibacter sp. A64]|uniref:glycoside hydrolase family 43 protein n=1 Tax=Lutibacter sp. A64 TaxID=2918526 RepID=UPI001F059107|nr:glycoside hydrolase family 43 protein [Lutibacter sp. A64]UMB54223.1 glycoside hydrolase family 43 protein [Lutibacter sp. A64]
MIRLSKILFGLQFIFCLLGCQDYQEKLSTKLEVQNENKFYTNPVVKRDFPDPTVIKAENGTYYAYATNTKIDGIQINIQILKSYDLLQWKTLPDALPEKPIWADKDFWAPHVVYNENTRKYYLFYSGESKGQNIGKCLGVAVSDSPEGPFKDKGEPLLCGEGFKNIDPMVYCDRTSGRNYLYWGSGFESIKVQELSDNFLSFKEGSRPKNLIFPISEDNSENYENLVEGAWLQKHLNFYYLYYSGDNCCGENAHYAVMVARSESPTGPFEKFKNNNGKPYILSNNDHWRAPGHNSVITDEEGQDWIMYHAIDLQDSEKGRFFLMDKIYYKNGWPIIGNGTPSILKIDIPKT